MKLWLLVRAALALTIALFARLKLRLYGRASFFGDENEPR